MAHAPRRLAVPALLGAVAVLVGAGPALAGPAASVPGAPTAVKATAGNARITVSWQAPTSTGGSAITSYAASCTGAGTTRTTKAAGSARSAVVAGLTNGTGYTCRVTATNAKGTGAASAATPTATPVGPPGAPSGVFASTKGATLTVAWAAPKSTGGSAVTGYTVACTSTDGGPALGGSAAASARKLTLAGLPGDKTYLCSVKATNAKGSSSAGAALDYVQHASVTGSVTSATVHAPVVAGQRATLAISSVVFTGDGCVDATVKAANGSSLSSGTACQGGGTVYVVTPGTYPAGGTATATLAPHSNTGTAELALYVYVDQHVATSVTAPPTTLAFPIPGQVARLTFTGRAKENVSIISTRGTAPGTLSLQNPAGTEILFGRYYDDPKGTYTTGPVTLPTAATYTVVVANDGYVPGGVTLQLRDSA